MDKFSLRIDEDIYNEVRREAMNNGLSLNKYINIALRRSLQAGEIITKKTIVLDIDSDGVVINARIR